MGQGQEEKQKALKFGEQLKAVSPISPNSSEAPFLH
jgi:hypothetical protein